MAASGTASTTETTGVAVVVPPLADGGAADGAPWGSHAVMAAPITTTEWKIESRPTRSD